MPGRPRLEDDQPELLKAIIDIAMFGGAADNRRRTELVQSCKTLEDLHMELEAQGFNLSKSGVYLRLLPRNSRTADGKRHVSDVPVKLCRAQADGRKGHRDGRFCTASTKSVEQLISILGARQVAIISQDDKSRVPLGLTAANKQALILMHLEYKMILPDHDWVAAPRHKLIPSVHAGIKIENGEIGDPKSVTYSGPTYIAIRSAKHCSSTADSHAFDIQKLVHLESFNEIIYDSEEVKPVLFIMSDGGPDENPRYQKVIDYAMHYLSLQMLLGEVPTIALSRELSGLILPHDHFGSHLKNSSVVVDEALGLKQFEFAGETLAEVWSKLVIDGYPVIAEYVKPECFAEKPKIVTPEWYNLHVQESQYLLQILKYADRTCCGDWRSNIKDILPISNGFLPPPFPLRRNDQGIVIIPNPDDLEDRDSFPDLCLRQSIGLKPVTTTGSSIPYDFYCPSVRDEIEGRTCDFCQSYFASKKQKAIHSKAIHGHNITEKQRATKMFQSGAQNYYVSLTLQNP